MAYRGGNAALNTDAQKSNVSSGSTCSSIDGKIMNVPQEVFKARALKKSAEAIVPIQLLGNANIGKGRILNKEHSYAVEES